MSLSNDASTLKRAVVVWSFTVLGSLAWASAAPLSAQTATVATEENFRAEPNGTLLGRIRPGTVLGFEGSDGDWIRATLEGWVWTPSLETTGDGGFDLRIGVQGGENLRVEPQGTVLARLEEGTLLEEVERGDGWIRVRRTAWIWRPSVELDAEAAALDGPSEPESGTPQVRAETDWTEAGPGGVAVLSAPDGDTLARGAPGTELRVLGRQGGWARVRLEGWAWMPDADVTGADVGGGVTDVDPSEVAEAPDRYRGRVVSWELQFISREQAEPVRTDFYEGEPFLLTRAAGGSSRFVYVAVPPERLEEIDVLTPLERIRVVGRIRTGSAALTGGPILDLLELSRVAGERGGASNP